jgi:hypothetical protein
MLCQTRSKVMIETKPNATDRMETYIFCQTHSLHTRSKDVIKTKKQELSFPCTREEEYDNNNYTFTPYYISF